MKKMKDPLQSKPTAYDILGLKEGYTKKDLDMALGQALKQGTHSMADIKTAHSVLKKKLSRVKHDLLLYHSEIFIRLEKSETIDETIFKPEQRLKTARKWEDVLKNDIVKRNTMDLSIVHALGVLWLQWFLSEQEKIFTRIRESIYSTGDNESNPVISYAFDGSDQISEFPVFYLGRQVIAYWGALYDNPNFYRDFGDFQSDEKVEQITDEATRMISNFFSRARAEIQSLNKPFLLEYKGAQYTRSQLDLLYARLETLLSAELRTARILRKYRFNSSYYGQLGRFGGREMMMNLDVKEEILKVLKTENKEDKNLVLMKNSFLSYFDLHYLLYEGKIDLLQFRIKNIPEAEKQTAEFKESALQLYLTLIKQAFVSGDPAAAAAYTETAVTFVNYEDEEEKDTAAQLFADFARTSASEYHRQSIDFMKIVKQKLKHPVITELYSKLILNKT